LPKAVRWNEWLGRTARLVECISCVLFYVFFVVSVATHFGANNWKYHTTTCDPIRLGNGNKVLHNVVGGNLGVFEGNGGDLRMGLALQSLHDGERWVHEPLRLTVIIDAPQEAIETVIRKHAVVKQLLDNGWLHLWRFEAAGFMRYVQGDWAAVVWEGQTTL
jgi:uncharacterized protein